jgi:hypothetical protein
MPREGQAVRPVYSTSVRSYVLAMDQLPAGTHIRRAHRRNGRPVRASIVRNPRRRHRAASTAPASPVSRGHGKVGLAVGVTVAVTIGFVAISGSFGGSAAGSAGNLSVQVKADLNEAVASLATLGFRGTRSANSGMPSPSYGRACAASATGGVRQFLARHLCKEYASAMLTALRQGASAQVAISWVLMPTVALAAQYKAEADAPLSGNPPGESLAFSGLCYASGQNGATVWTEQVEPIGPLRINVERQILQAAAPGKLAAGYLRQHCVG